MSRRTYAWRDGALVELGADYVPETRAPRAPVSDLYMDGARATDGTDIGSRKKRREYMQANQLADFDDYKETWAAAARQRERAMSGETGTQERREIIARELQKRRRA